MTASLIIDFSEKSHTQDIFVTGMIAVAAVAVIALFVYLVAVKQPDGEIAFSIVIGGLIAAIGWPAVVVGGLLTGLVLGLRWVVHAPKPWTNWRSGRRQRRLAEAMLRSGVGRKELPLVPLPPPYRIKEDPTADYVAGRIEVEELERRVAERLEEEGMGAERRWYNNG